MTTRRRCSRCSLRGRGKKGRTSGCRLRLVAVEAVFRSRGAGLRGVAWLASACCIRLTRFRGTPEEPGLMMSLVPGGSCRGALLRVAGERVVDDLRKLWRREMTVKPPNTPPRWVEAKTAHGLVPAIVFAANRRGPNYVSGLAEDDIAGVLCRAAGHWGSGAEYLLQTVDQTRAAGHPRYPPLAPAEMRGPEVDGAAIRYAICCLNRLAIILLLGAAAHETRALLLAFTRWRLIADLVCVSPTQSGTKY